MNINLTKARKPSKRVGRGPSSNKGKTSGRGMNGQRSRSGASTAFRTGGQTKLYMQLPKVSPLKARDDKSSVVISSDFIIKMFKKDDVVSLDKIKVALKNDNIKSVKIIKGNDKLEPRRVDKSIKCSKNIKSIFQNA